MSGDLNANLPKSWEVMSPKSPYSTSVNLCRKESECGQSARENPLFQRFGEPSAICPPIYSATPPSMLILAGS